MDIFVAYDSSPQRLPIAVADSASELARITGNTYAAVASSISKGRPKYARVHIEDDNYNNQNKFWSEEDIMFLTNNYMSLTDDEMAIVLKRTKRSVSKKRIKLNLRRKKDKGTEQ